MITQPTLTIRPFETRDYEAIAAINNRVTPDYPTTAAELQGEDERFDSQYRWERFIAEKDGEVVAFALYEPDVGSYHPQKFHLNISVLPEHEGQGIGTALYKRLLEALAPLNPITLRSGDIISETATRSLRFAERNGFTEERRMWVSTLDVAAFDETLFADAEAKAEAHGITIRSLSELRNDPEHKRKFYELFSDVRLDIPRSEAPTPVPYESFCGFFYDDPGFLYDATFVALDGETYIGLSDLYKREETETLYVGLTGVKRDYRNKGIALALKMRGIRYAKEHGAPFLITDNDSMNRPMLSINEKLGFVKKPAVIKFVKKLEQEA